jgi:hypothetical protein
MQHDFFRRLNFTRAFPSVCHSRLGKDPTESHCKVELHVVMP